VSKNDRTLFYKHMGHSSTVNANVYQTPLAEAEITHVGMHLTSIDGQVPCRSSEVLDSVPHQSDVSEFPCFEFHKVHQDKPLTEWNGRCSAI